MSGLFELDKLAKRFRTYVERSDTLKPEAVRLLEEALFRGEFERGEVPRAASFFHQVRLRAGKIYVGVEQVGAKVVRLHRRF